MILVAFNFMLKLTFNKWGYVLGVAAVCALFVALIWTVAIEQSKTQIQAWLTNQQLMLDTSVVMSIEVVLQMSFCMLAAHLRFTGRVRKRVLWTYKILRGFPGVLMFAVLFAVLTELIFAFPGVDFRRTAYLTAAGVFVVLPVGAIGLRKLLPEKDLRLELLFLANALVMILGVVATVNGRTAVRGFSEVEWGAVGGMLLIVAAGAGIGLLIYRAKEKRKLKKEKQ